MFVREEEAAIRNFYGILKEGLEEYQKIGD